MVAPEHCVPCIVLSHLGLPVKDDVLKLLEICRYQDPFLIAHKVYLQVMEAEYHGELPCIASCIFEAVFHGSAGHLAHCDDPRVSAEGGVMHFLQILMDLGTVSVVFTSVAGLIVFVACLADQIDHVETESSDSFLHPEF